MFCANFKPKSLVLLDFLLLFSLTSVRFNTEKAGSPRQVTRFISSLILANQNATSVRPLQFCKLAELDRLSKRKIN
jgi:hypothetical protein